MGPFAALEAPPCAGRETADANGVELFPAAGVFALDALDGGGGRLCPQKRQTTLRGLSCGQAHSLQIQTVLWVGFSVQICEERRPSDFPTLPLPRLDTEESTAAYTGLPVLFKSVSSFFSSPAIRRSFRVSFLLGWLYQADKGA